MELTNEQRELLTTIAAELDNARVTYKNIDSVTSKREAFKLHGLRSQLVRHFKLNQSAVPVSV